MFCGQKIKTIAEQKGLKVKDLYEGANIKSGTFFTILSDKGNPTADKLEAIADFLGCSIDEFFERKSCFQNQQYTVSGNGNKVQQGTNNVMEENQAKEIEYLHVLLREKELRLTTLLELIKEKDRIIELLEKSK